MSLVRAMPGRVVAVMLVAAALGGFAQTASAARQQHAGVQQMYDLLMCTVCHESLSVAQSPESYEERAVVRQYVAQGLTVKQIERRMVAQYGPQVLAQPPKHGFGLLVYVVPPVVVLLGIGVVLYTIPRWRRRDRAGPAVAGGPALTEQDSQRLERELAERS